jgi:hypothetical protein
VLREVIDVAKRKPTPARAAKISGGEVRAARATKPKKVAPKKPAAKMPKPAGKPKPPPRPAPVADASPELLKLGFFRGEFHWELDRHVPAFDSRLRINVDHVNGVVTPEQVRAVELLLETKTSLRPPAVRAAYECMLRWVEGYQKRHPDFRGKPIGEKPFSRGCELKTVSFPVPPHSEAKPAPYFVLSLFWPDDNRPCEARFEWAKGAWVVTQCERT